MATVAVKVPGSIPGAPTKMPELGEIREIGKNILEVKPSERVQFWSERTGIDLGRPVPPVTLQRRETTFNHHQFFVDLPHNLASYLHERSNARPLGTPIPGDSDTINWYERQRPLGVAPRADAQIQKEARRLAKKHALWAEQAEWRYRRADAAGLLNEGISPLPAGQRLALADKLLRSKSPALELAIEDSEASEWRRQGVDIV